MVTEAQIDTVLSILGQLGIFTIAAGLIGWIVRRAISQYFDRELAEYQADMNKELNQYQSKLDKELSEHQAEIDKGLDEYRHDLEKERLRYSELHTMRAEITAELYTKFVELEADMRKLTHPMETGSDPPKKELRNKAADSGNEFVNFYMKNKIYFPPNVCEIVEEIQEEMKGVFDEWIVYRPHEDQPGKNVDFERWLKLWKTVTENEVPELKRELEEHFRGLLGVEPDQQK